MSSTEELTMDNLERAVIANNTIYLEGYIRRNFNPPDVMDANLIMLHRQIFLRALKNGSIPVLDWCLIRVSKEDMIWLIKRTDRHDKQHPLSCVIRNGDVATLEWMDTHGLDFMWGPLKWQHQELLSDIVKFAYSGNPHPSDVDIKPNVECLVFLRQKNVTIQFEKGYDTGLPKEALLRAGFANLSYQDSNFMGSYWVYKFEGKMQPEELMKRLYGINETLSKTIESIEKLNVTNCNQVIKSNPESTSRVNGCLDAIYKKMDRLKTLTSRLMTEAVETSDQTSEMQ
mgnify:CR=1 FL=1